MATNTLTSQLTLSELAKRSLNGQIQDIAETLSIDIPVLQNAVWIPCNQKTSYTFSQRLTLPSGSWRQINAGVSEEASVTKQVTEGTGMLEAYSTVDAELMALAGNDARFRMTEDKAFLEGLMQTFGTAICYGNTATDPEQIDGWATRYASTGTHVKSASGSGSDTTSVWFIQWGPDKCHFIYPEGSDVGMRIRDLGEQTVLDGSDNPYQAYRTYFQFHVGFAVHDARAIGRIANIETTGGSNLFDPDLGISIINQSFNRGSGMVMYMNATVLTQVDIQAMDKNNGYYTVKEVFGVPTSHFRQIPILKFDSIVDTETAIT